MARGQSDPVRGAAVFREHGAGATVVKLGSKGCAVFEEGHEHWLDGFKIAAVDTTGAGDCFSGAFLAALQRSMTVRDAACFANAAGALSVQKPGATTGLLDYEATLAWMGASMRATASE